MSQGELHNAQLSILYNLRRTESATFTMLMRPTGLPSDAFKFHLRRLAKLGYIEKGPQGEYSLTLVGKEFANNLDRHKKAPRKQAKLSMFIMATRPHDQGTLYLMQRRLRQPYLGFWGNISGPVYWGETVEAAAAREFSKQTGLTAHFTVKSTYHQRDFLVGTPPVLLEDKFFLIIEATDIQGELTNAWSGGHNQWMSLEEFMAQKERFDSVRDVAHAIEHLSPFIHRDVYYDETQY